LFEAVPPSQLLELGLDLLKHLLVELLGVRTAPVKSLGASDLPAVRR
jgi:hypothetical protein